MKFPHAAHVNMSLAMEHRNDPDTVNSVAHMIPGTMLFLIGVSVVYCSIYRYYLCEREVKGGAKNPRKYESSVLYPIWPKTGKPIECYFAIAGSCSGFIIEAAWFGGFNENYVLHNLLYIGFLLSSVLDYMAKRHYPLPKLTEYYSTLLIVWADGLLFFTHSFKQALSDSAAHARISMTCGVIGLFVLLEIYDIHRMHTSVARGFTLQLLGMWFCITGRLVLYPFNLVAEYNTRHAVMQVDMMFVSAMFICAFLTLLLGTIAYRRVRNLTMAQVSKALDYEYAMINDPSNFNQNIKYIYTEDSEPLVYKKLDASESTCCI